MAKKKISEMTSEEKSIEIENFRAREEAREKELANDEESLKLKKQELEIIIAQNKALGERFDAKQNELKLLEVLEKLQGDAYKSISEYNDLRKQLDEATEEATKKEIEDKIKQIEQLAEQEDGYAKLYIQLIKNTKGTEKLTKAQKEAKKSFDDTFGSIALATGLNSRMMNNFSNSITQFTELAKQQPEQLKQSFLQTFSVQKMGLAFLGQVIEKTLELARATDKASAAFAANTGAGRIMTEQIAAVGGKFRNIGLDAEKAGQAAQDLYNNFSGFMSIGKATQQNLMATVASLGKLGIDGTTASKTLVLFNKNMGMSLAQSQKLTKQLAMMGTKIGISSSQMVKGFAEASKSLAVYGKDAVNVFSDLAAQAKAANVETSTLLGLAEKFDTFSGAADAAGKLNSILGAQLSATDLLTMKENERIETLISSMQAQGRNFKDLDRYSQKAIAAAAGISDMSEAQRIFTMSISDYRKGLRKNASEEQFQQSLKDTMDIMEKLQRIGQQFAIGIAPVLDGIASFLQGVLDFNKAVGGWFVPAIAILLTAALIIPKIVGLFAPLMALFSTAAPAAVPGINVFAQGLAKAAPAFMKGALGLLAVGAALVLFAVGLTMMSGAFGGNMGFENVFGALSGLGLGLIVLAGGLVALGAIAAAGGGIGFLLIAAGAASMASALLMIGAAISSIKDIEVVKSLADIIGGFGDFIVNFKVGAFSEVDNFLSSLDNLDASMKPVLGDLALIATGKTTQSVTANTAAYNFNTFSANFKNIFKPEITVKIGDKELKGMIDEQIANSSRNNNS